MKTDQFIKLLERNQHPNKNGRSYVTITNSTDHRIGKVKEMIGKGIDFKCDIKNNRCKNFRNNSANTCCCNNCQTSIGYMKHIFEPDLKYYAKHFSRSTGFWRKGKGCALPYRLRSNTCVFFNCHPDATIKNGLYTLRNILNDMEQIK
jgi:hypothetical protein